MNFPDLPLLQSHRGFWVLGKTENTLESLQEAKAQGYQMVEFDVQVSSDGIPFLFHDRILKNSLDVQTQTFSFLKNELNVSSLQEILKSPDVPDLLNIEIKSPSGIGPYFEKAILSCIEKSETTKKILFSSFSPLSLIRMRALSTKFPIALLATDIVEPGNSLFLRHLWSLHFFRPDLLHLHSHMFTPERVKKWKMRRYKLVAWTVNDTDEAQRLIRIGVDSIITDRILRLE